MTNLELQYRFIQKLGDSINLQYDIPTIDIQRYLNVGCDDFIEFWYKQYDQSEAAKKRLITLTKRTSIALSTATESSNEYIINPNNFKVYSITLPSDCLYVLREKVDLYNEVLETYTTVPVKPIGLDYMNKHIDNSFKQPYSKLYWRIDVAGKHELILPTSIDISTSNYILEHIKIPTKINLLTGTPVTDKIEINEDFHEEIVDFAIRKFLSNYSLVNQNNNSNKNSE